MIDSLLDVTVFTRVVSAGSLSAAARELGMSLAVVSKRPYPHTRGVAAKVKVFIEFLGGELRAAYRWGGMSRVEDEAAP